MFPGTNALLRAGTAAVCGVPIILPASQLVATGDPRVESVLQLAAGGAIALALWIARGVIQRVGRLDRQMQEDRIRTQQRLARIELDTATQLADIQARLARVEKDHEKDYERAKR